MSCVKDLWIQGFDEAYGEAIEQGLTEREAQYTAIRYAEETASMLQDHADTLRKAAKEQG